MAHISVIFSILPTQLQAKFTSRLLNFQQTTPISENPFLITFMGGLRVILHTIIHASHEGQS